METAQQFKQYVVNVTVKLRILTDPSSALSIEDILSEMHYDFTPDSEHQDNNVSVIHSDMWDYDLISDDVITIKNTYK